MANKSPSDLAPIEPWWERSYLDLAVSTFGPPSAEIVRLVDLLPPGATILDLMCGDGRNALYMARHNLHVEAIDKSEAGIAKLRVLARAEDLNIDARVRDVHDIVLDDKRYDAILNMGSLQLIERRCWSNVIFQMKSATRVGGYNIVTVLTKRFPPPEDLAPFCVGLFHDGELFRAYSDWEVIEQKKTVKTDMSQGPARFLPLDRLVAKRHA